MHRDISLVRRLNNASSILKTGCFPSSMVSGSGLVIVGTLNNLAYPSGIAQEVRNQHCVVIYLMLNRHDNCAYSNSSTVKRTDTSTRQHSCHAIKHMIQRPSKSMPHYMPVLPRISPYNAFLSHAPAYHIGQEVTA